MSQYDPAEIIRQVAPCGLSCGNCLAFEGGPIQSAASELRQRLGPNFSGYAERFAGMNAVFGKYPDFSDLLSYMSSGTCGGCRGEGCLFTSCKVGHCVKAQGVDFCFQCELFPCDTHGMPPMLKDRWQKNNERMRDQGVEAYYQTVKDKPRYP